MLERACDHALLHGGAEQKWSRMREESGVEYIAGQRWYCNCCTARYRPKFGMLVEVVADGATYWMLAKFPTDWHDVKWMSVEERHSGASSPAELFKMLEEVRRYMGDGMLRPALKSEIWKGTEDGVYKVVDPALLLSMPHMLSFTKQI